MKKYIVSSFVANIAVGLTDEATAKQDINLAHSLFNTHVNYNYFNGVLSFYSLKKFYRFLIYKNLFAIYKRGVKYRLQLKRAANITRQTLNNDVEHQNFMPQIYQHEQTYHIYKYQNQKFRHATK